MNKFRRKVVPSGDRAVHKGEFNYILIERQQGKSKVMATRTKIGFAAEMEGERSIKKSMYDSVAHSKVGNSSSVL